MAIDTRVELKAAERLKGRYIHQLSTKIGRKKIFEDGNILYREAVKYFDWCDKNPLNRSEIVKYKEDFDQALVPIGRPYTMTGLCVYLGVSEAYFRTAKSQLKAKGNKIEEYEQDIVDAIEFIETIVRNNQIEGASVGMFNPAIIARLNGLTDKTDITSGDKPLMNIVVRDKKTAEFLDDIESIL